MNSLQKAYVDGASMAYKDAADKIDELIELAPTELKPYVMILKPFGDALRLKSKCIYTEAERLEGVRH